MLGWLKWSVWCITESVTETVVVLLPAVFAVVCDLSKPRSKVCLLP